MASSNVETYRAGHQAFNQRDFEAMTKRYAGSITWTDHLPYRLTTVRPLAHHLGEDSLVNLLVLSGGGLSLMAATGRVRLAAIRANLTRKR